MTALHNPPAGTAFVQVHHEFGTGAPWESTFKMLTTGAIVNGDVDQLCAAVCDAWIAQVQIYLNISDIVLGAAGQLWTGAEWLDGTATADAPGSGSGHALAVGTCCVASWTGSWHYRGGKPRTYISGISAERMSTSRDFDPSFLGDLASGMNAFADDVNALTPGNITTVALGVVLGRSHIAAGTFAPFTGVRMNPIAASQRRRNRQP